MTESKKPSHPRTGEALQIGREIVSFGRNIISATSTGFTLEHRLFVNDPWELIAEAIARAVPAVKNRDIAQSFRRQAQDYFRAATVSSELPVRPVLLYYAFLNLSKAYLISKGSITVTGKASHGISFPRPRPRAIPGSPINFEGRKPAVFHELLERLDGSTALLSSPLRLGYLLPQILPGHRLWCYATGYPERFLSVERFEIRHSPTAKEVWLSFYLNSNDLARLGLTETTVLTRAGLGDFEYSHGFLPPIPDCYHYQQKKPLVYASEPGGALAKIVQSAKNLFWETVKLDSPYRKSYIYCCPTREHKVRMPQMLSIYLLMFILASVTRYFPGYFEELLESKYGPFFQTFVSESPMQFLYLMASEIVGCEVSKPTII
jgi:hypothetical protein